MSEISGFKAKTIVINGRFLTQSVTGVQRYARELVQAIDNMLDDRKDLKVHLLTPQIDTENIPSFRNIIHRAVGRFQGHLWEQMDLPRYVGDATLFCPGNTAPVASLFGSARVVVTVHDLSYLYFPDAYSRSFRLLYRTLIPLILRKADAVITVSMSEKNSILKYYPYAENRLSAVQNGGLPVGVIQMACATRPTAPTVLYVGSLSKRKNFPGMLEVARRLARKRHLRFVFVGGVPEGLVDSLADVPEDVRDRIEFLGQVNEWNSLMEQYSSASCFFFPSFYEASPLPPIEAMACGCPVIASRIPSLVERCGDAALYCDPQDVEDMCRMVEKVIDNPLLQNDLREMGYRQADRYSWHNCALQTINIMLNRAMELC